MDSHSKRKAKGIGGESESFEKSGSGEEDHDSGEETGNTTMKSTKKPGLRQRGVTEIGTVGGIGRLR